MDLKKIKALLSDYYEGKTSREEETLITEYFMNSDVPSELEADRLLFLSLSGASSQEIPDNEFDEKLFAAIETHNNKINLINSRRIRYMVSGIAAGILILLGSYFFLVDKQVGEIIYAKDKYTVDETMLAYEDAKNALMLVSRVMNTGTGELEALSKITDVTNDFAMIRKFNQGTVELQMLYKFEDTKNKISTNH